MLHKLILNEGTTLDEAIRLLDANGNGFLPVVDEAGKLVGIFTDGDLRKGLLKHKQAVHEIINRNPTVATTSESRNQIIRKLHNLKRRHMPIVDENGLFVDVVVLNDFNLKHYDNQVVIMAGGLGTRLGELTQHTPKPMLKINGKPILERLIEGFQNNGFSNFVICVNYKSDVIMDHFGDGSKFGVTIHYTEEKKRLGTSGALSLIDRSLLQLPFIVTNGDILTLLNFEDFLDAHLKNNAAATMGVKQYSMQLPYANIIVDDDGNLVSLEEKPLVPFYINAGIYACSPNVLDLIPLNEYFDMPSLFTELKRRGEVVKTFKIDDYWIDIGLPNDFQRANETLF